MERKKRRDFDPESTDVDPISDEVHSQVLGTCYANAIATVIRATESRIVGRIIEDHKKMVDRIVSKWGTNGAYTFKVLQEECIKRQLSCKYIDERACQEALKQGRAIIATFALDAKQWGILSFFFSNAPEQVLKKSEFNERGGEICGHAVVISGWTDSYWKIKNSWGTGFADKGYFRVSKDAMEF